MKETRDKHPIAWQNKDITSKILAEEFKGKSFSVYGLDLPEIVTAEPTDLPAVEANELRLDNLFQLRDGSYAIVDYESKYIEENKLKYLGYIARVSKRLYNEHRQFERLRIIIIYTAGVKRGSTAPILDIGCAVIKLEEAFLSDFDPVSLWRELSTAVRAGDHSDEVLMKLIIYPLTRRTKKAQKTAVGRAIDLAEKISDKKRQIFVLTGIYVFADKVITDEDAERIRRIMKMTKVEQIYTRERIAAVNEAVNAVMEEEQRKRETEREEAALRLLREDITVDKIAFCLNMPIARVKELKQTLLS